MAKSTSLAKVDSGTLANISIVLFVGVLAIVHLKAVIQPLVVATLIFFLIRPSTVARAETGRASTDRVWGTGIDSDGIPTVCI